MLDCKFAVAFCRLRCGRNNRKYIAAKIKTNGNILRIGLLFVVVCEAAINEKTSKLMVEARVIDIAIESSGLWLVVNRASPCGQKPLTKLGKIAL